MNKSDSNSKWINECSQWDEEVRAYTEYVDHCLAFCTCRKTIEKLYAMTPSNGWFTIQVLKESDEILDSVSFRKDNRKERETGEVRLQGLITKILGIHGQGYPYPRITSEFTYGFRIDYTVRVYIEEAARKS